MKLLLLVAAAAVLTTSIYTLSFTDADGNTVNMSSYQNKKILLVNIATNSPRVAQLSGLQQLHQEYGDSVAILAFPSNSFGNETRSNAEIKQFCLQNYGVTFKIAAQGSVSGMAMQPIYGWLANAAENGVMNVAILRDFEKVLVDKNGQIIGVFAPALAPTSQQVVDAITDTNN
jgi:glutathione peroxidase